MQRPNAVPSSINQAHFPLRNKTYSVSSRQPARHGSLRRLNLRHSTADDIIAAKNAWTAHQKQHGLGQSGSVAPGATDAAAQRQLQEIEQAVFSEMAPNTTSDTTYNMTYEDLLNKDHEAAEGNTDDTHDVSGEPATEVNKAAESQSKKAVKAPWWPSTIAVMTAFWNNPGEFWKQANTLQKAIPVISIFVAGIAGLFASWQTAKFAVSFAISLTRIHTWLMIMGLAVISLITPQAPKINGLLRLVDDYNLFANYGQAKHAISMVTWSSIACFLMLVFLAGSM